MAQTSPFVKRKIMCPMCGKESHQFSLPPNLYSIEEKESDQHPLRLKWYNPDFQNVKPHHYALFHCPFCYFTDFEENFCNAQSLANFQGLKKLVFEKNQIKDKILRFLHGRISYENMTFESTLFLHLTAIYIYDLETKEQYRDFKKLSRLFHRLGWIYREQNPTHTDSENSSLVKEINLNLNLLVNQHHEVLKRYKPVHESIKRRVLDLGLTFDSPKNPYLTPLTQFDSILRDFEKFISDIRQIASKDVQLISSEPNSQQLESSDSNLERLTKVWLNCPLNERDSLSKAIECYEKLYAKVSATDSLNQQIGLLTILLDLCVRIDDYEKANEYLNSLYKFCSESRQQLFQRQRSDPSGKTESQINKLGDTMENLSETRREILSKKYEFYKPRFEKLLEEHKGEYWEDIKVVLEENNIPIDVISKIESTFGESEQSDEPTVVTKQKKKFLGLF
jgi:hypothetical protein